MPGTGWICRTCLRQLHRTQKPRLASYATSAGRSPSPHSHDCPQLTIAAAVANGTLSPALLLRARAQAKEHDSLSAQLASSFEAASAKRAGELAPVVSALSQYDSANASLAELHTLLQDPESDKELRELAAEDIASTQDEVESASRALTTALVPRHPFAHLGCLIEIRPGVGGNEAALFAADLLRMYQMYCSRSGLRAALLSFEDAAGVSDPNGSDAPLHEAILEVQTEGSYGIFRGEAGVHRVQRVPATESKGRTHTSAAAVLVLPSLPEHSDGMENMDDPESDYYVSSADVRTDVMRSRGAGGQHVNTTDSAVRLTHNPTGTVVAVQDSRSQLQNRAKAWLILRARLAQIRREAREEEVLKMRRSAVGYGKTGRGDKIRTYNWGQQRVTDHRSGLTINQLDGVMEGGDALDQVMGSVRAWYQDREIEALLDDTNS